MLKLDFICSQPLGEVSEAAYQAARANMDRRYYYARSQEGHTYPQASIDDYAAMLADAMNLTLATGTVDSKALVERYAELRGHDARWAARAYRSIQQQKIGAAIDKISSHEALQWLAHNELLTATHKSALKHQPFYSVISTLCQNAKVASIMNTLRQDLDKVVSDNTEKLLTIRRHEAQIEQLQVQGASLQAQINALTGRVEELEAEPPVVVHAWQEEAIRLRRANKTVREIAAEVGKGKSAVAEFLQRVRV